MSGGGAGGSRTTIAPTGTIDAMAMTTGDIVAIERATATMADVMRAVTAGGDAVGIATTIDPEGPESNHHSGTKEPAVSAGFLLARSARGRDARGVGLEDCRKDSVIVLELGATDDAPLAGEPFAGEGRRGEIGRASCRERV